MFLSTALHRKDGKASNEMAILSQLSILSGAEVEGFVNFAALISMNLGSFLRLGDDLTTCRIQVTVATFCCVGTEAS